MNMAGAHIANGGISKNMKDSLTIKPSNAKLKKHSLAELDEVLDQIQISPAWIAKLEQIIEDANSK